MKSKLSKISKKRFQAKFQAYFSTIGLEQTALATDFILMPLQEKMAFIYRTCLHLLFEKCPWSYEIFERSVHEVEKQLRHVPQSWLELNPYIEHSIARIGETDPIEMKRMQKQWGYSLPQLGEMEKKFLQELITGPLYKAGILNLGYDEKKIRYFKITPYGASLLQ
jgi:hypothetical protein